MTQALPEPAAPSLSSAEATRLAEAHGLREVGTRPPFGSYLKSIWARRAFLWTLARAHSRAKHQGHRLGQVWSVLNPLLLVLSYYLVFGLLIKTPMGAGNRVAFLSIGVILFSVAASVVTSGSRSIVNNTSLMRSLHFPRAMLPISVALTELIASLPACAVLFGLVLLTGETPTWTWLLLPVAMTGQMLILTGIALIGARIVHLSTDLGNLIPVLIRVLRYVSGVFFSINHVATEGPLRAVLNYQPFALPLTTAREALLEGPDYAIVPQHWIALGAWAVGLLVVGLVVFWQDEARYGRG